jgi:glycosyltransferase involved in cell wall biosynthesis
VPTPTSAMQSAPPDNSIPATARFSVVILTLNEAKNLPDCLASLRDLDCEVFVVDSGSSDCTIEIAEQAGASVFTHPFEGYGVQRNWALRELPFSCEWVLNLDADERLTPELAREIAATMAAPLNGINGFMLRRRTVFMGRWIRHGGHYPNYQLRLFRRDAGQCEDRLYDQHFVVNGRTAALRNDYIDVVAAELSTWSARHIRWAGCEATESMGRDAVPGPRVPATLTGGRIAQKRWLREKVYGQAPLFVRPLAYWLYRYFIRLGFLDGKEGLVFHFLQGFWYRLLVDAIILERRAIPADPAATVSGSSLHKSVSTPHN